MKRVIYLLMSVFSSALLVSGVIWQSQAKTLSERNASVLGLIKEVPSCYSGGLGARSCSISAGTNIAGMGVSAGCSVTCDEGYYACCSLQCTCVNTFNFNPGRPGLQ